MYVAAFAPSEGEASANLGKDYAVPPGIATLQAERANTRYLPSVAFPDRLVLQSGEASLAQALSGQDLVILATPVSAALSMMIFKKLGVPQ